MPRMDGEELIEKNFRKKCQFLLFFCNLKKGNEVVGLLWDSEMSADDFVKNLEDFQLKVLTVKNKSSRIEEKKITYCG